MIRRFSNRRFQCINLSLINETSFKKYYWISQRIMSHERENAVDERSPFVHDRDSCRDSTVIIYQCQYSLSCWIPILEGEADTWQSPVRNAATGLFLNKCIMASHFARSCLTRRLFPELDSSWLISFTSICFLLLFYGTFTSTCSRRREIREWCHLHLQHHIGLRVSYSKSNKKITFSDTFLRGCKSPDNL